MDMGGISAGMRIGRFFKIAASALAATVGAVKEGAQKLIAINEQTAQQDQSKWNRRQRRSYRGWLYRRFKQNIAGTKLERKAYLGKLGGRTTRLIRRFEVLQKQRILAALRAEVAAGRAI